MLTVLECLKHVRIPTNVQEADDIIATCSGQPDWRPLFVIGAETAILITLVVVGLLLAWRFIR